MSDRLRFQRRFGLTDDDELRVVLLCYLSLNFRVDFRRESNLIGYIVI